MELITILIALGVEAWFSDLNFDRYRNLGWFERYGNWLEARMGRIPRWNGALGVLVTLFIPLGLLGLTVYAVAEVHFVFGYIISFLVLIYSFGPAINLMVNRYIEALNSNDDSACREIIQRILPAASPAEVDGEQLIGALVFKAHEYLFAVIFWFFVLGAVGALLYCLTLSLFARYEKIHGGYADAARDLHNLLMWPSARLLALGFALGGSLTGAMENWRAVTGDTLDASEEVITAAGTGALQKSLDKEQEELAGREGLVARLKETLALINRTLIVWLIVLGVMTIGGWLA